MGGKGFTAILRTGVLVAVALASTTLSGCKIMRVEQDRALRARRGQAFDASVEAQRVWPQALAALDHVAVPMDRLLPALATHTPAAGARFGRRTGEGAPWTFVGRGSGVITAIDTASRRGTLEVALTGLSPARTVRLQVGPVITGTAVRDALPFLAFDDFADQLAFADMGRALTDRALAGVRPALAGLRPGMRITFTGAFNAHGGGDPLLLTPTALARVG